MGVIIPRGISIDLAVHRRTDSRSERCTRHIPRGIITRVREIWSSIRAYVRSGSGTNSRRTTSHAFASAIILNNIAVASRLRDATAPALRLICMPNISLLEVSARDASQALRCVSNRSPKLKREIADCEAPTFGAFIPRGISLPILLINSDTRTLETC